MRLCRTRGRGRQCSGNLDMATLTKSGGSKLNGGAKSRSAGAKEPSASTEGGSRKNASRQEVSDHIGSMLETMRRLAHQKDMSLLYFLIGAAVEEANAEKASRA